MENSASSLAAGEVPNAALYLSELELHYPRIAEKLVATWNLPESERYLNELSIDARGGRAGFGQEVIVEIMLLFNLKSEARGDIWDFWITNNPYYEEMNAASGNRRRLDIF